MMEKATCEVTRDVIDQQLHRIARRAPDSLRHAIEYSLVGGKRARGLLLLVSGEPTDPRDADQFMLLCAATCLELLHAATLVQDDIFDKSRIRRGRPATHCAFGSQLATLASDWMLAEAIRGAYRLHPDYGDALSACAQAMIAGEARELAPPANRTLAAFCAHAHEVARGKTGELFGLAFAAPSLLREDAEGAERLTLCGRELGIAFQYLDDALDLYGANEIFGGEGAGKDLNRDLDGYLLTLPVLDALPLLPHSASLALLGSGAPLPAHVLDALHSPAIREYVFARAHSQWQEAMDALGRELPDGNAVSVLLYALANAVLPGEFRQAARTAA
jgi:geranylgeranyl pyrophosphate synthase